MASAINIVLADALATPVNHTFIPIGADKNGVFYWEDQSAASTIGNNKISMSFIAPTNPVPGVQSTSSRQYKIRFVLTEPILETLGTQTISGIPPAPTIAYIDRCAFEYYLAERSTLQNRKDLRKMSANLLTDPQVIKAIETLEKVW